VWLSPLAHSPVAPLSSCLIKPSDTVCLTVGIHEPLLKTRLINQSLNFEKLVSLRDGQLVYVIASVCYNALTMKEEQRLYQERIVADPQILAGKPVVKGTRIGVDLVLEELSHNPDIHELLAAHPDLTRDDVQACLAYAQAIVTGKEVSPKPPKGARSDAAL
jgi:uncharacterized protein (DUF433 family)